MRDKGRRGEDREKPPARGNGSDRLNRGGGGKMYPRANYVNATRTMGMPAEYATADGRHLASDPLADRDFLNRPSVIMWPWQDINWGLQSGSNSVLVNAGSYVTSLMFNEIIMELQAARLINLSNVQLQNPVAAPAIGLAYTPTSFQYWLNLYTQAAVVMRACESILAGVEFNYTTSLLANAVQQNMPQLDALCDLLKPIKVPQGLVDHIDRISGFKTLTPSDPVELLGLPTQATLAVDYTNPGLIQTALGQAITTATRLGQPSLGAGTAANYLSDFQLIKSYFALAYGNSASWPTKGVSSNPSDYWQIYGGVSSFYDSTGAKYYSWPNAQGLVNNLVPILCPKGMSPEDGKYMLSLLGMTRYTTDIPGVIAAGSALNSVGLYQTSQAIAAGFGPTSFATYNQGGGVAISTEAAAGAQTTIFSNTELEVNFWLAYDRALVVNAGGGYNADRRSLRDLDIIKGRTTDLDGASVQYLKDMFIKPILGR